jgi:hypothetical protein
MERRLISPKVASVPGLGNGERATSAGPPLGAASLNALQPKPLSMNNQTSSTKKKPTNKEITRESANLFCSTTYPSAARQTHSRCACLLSDSHHLDCKPGELVGGDFLGNAEGLAGDELEVVAGRDVDDGAADALALWLFERFGHRARFERRNSKYACRKDEAPVTAVRRPRYMPS